MRKHSILILSMLFFILTISCVSAVDNDTNIVTEQNTDVISINEQDNDNLSISEEENEPVSAINKNNFTILTVTNDGEILAGDNNSDVLTVSSSENVLSSEVTVTPLSSSNYKTPTKKQRTFNIGGYKVVLSQSQYKKLYQISLIEDYFFEGDYKYYYVGEKYNGYDITTSGLRTQFTVKTNKFVKVKLKAGKKTHYKKSRVYFLFSYGQGQCGVAYRHMVQVVHYYGFFNRYYSYVKVLGNNAKYFGKCKCSGSFTKLNKSKLYKVTTIYKKYTIL